MFKYWCSQKAFPSFINKSPSGLVLRVRTKKIIFLFLNQNICCGYFAGLDMWRVPVVQSEQHMICRLTASGGQGGPSKHGRNWQRKTAVSGSSPQLTLKKGAPGDQVWDLLCVQLASYLERGPLMWMMPLHLHVNQKSDYDDDDSKEPSQWDFWAPKTYVKTDG